MSRYWWSVALAFCCLSTAAPALACRMTAPLHLKDIEYADVVVVGRIANYEIVRDKEFRRKMLTSPSLSPETSEIYLDKDRILMSDYARFDVLVDEILAGVAPRKISVTTYSIYKDDSTTLGTESHLFALQKPGSRIPPLRGPSATLMPAPAAGLTVLQAPCGPRFIFAKTSDEARAARSILGGRRN